MCSAALSANSVAGAHNSFESSDPADGATLATPPTQILLNFAKDVPLDSASITLKGPDGSRSDIPTISSGSSAAQLIVPLTGITDGSWSVRWKLVSSDGHAITDTVDFSVAAQASTSTTTMTPSSVDAATSATLPSTAGPATTVVAPITVVTAPNSVAVAQSEQTLDEEGTFSTPGPLGWLLRIASYSALVVLVGGLAVGLLLWPQRWADRMVQRPIAYALIALVGLSLLSMLFTTADIVGSPPWAILGDVWANLGYGPVKGAAARAVISIAMAVTVLPLDRLLRADAERPDPTPVAVALGGLALGFSMAGHAASLRLPVIGVPLDVAHLLAAALWLGALLYLGPFGGPSRRAPIEQWRDAVTNFSKVANVAVSTIVATGVFQAVRTDGLALFSSAHGLLTMLKVVLLGLLLWAANVNRNRVSRRLRAAQPVSPGIAGALRRAMATELGVGGVILAITAVLVTQSPGGA